MLQLCIYIYVLRDIYYDGFKELSTIDVLHLKGSYDFKTEELLFQKKLSNLLQMFPPVS